MAETFPLPDEKCLVCGGELDTGWECNDCGWDGIYWYNPLYRPPTAEEIRRLETGKEQP
jgi:hypothetical protein